MYAARRIALEDVPSPNAILARALRDPGHPHFVSMIFPFSGFSRKCRNDLTSSEIKTFRTECAAAFKLAVSPATLIQYADQVDQEQEGACTFVSLLNNEALVKRKDLIKHSAWKSSWRKFGKESCEDLAECLDLCDEHNLLLREGSSDLVYVPIRSRGKREMCFNTSFWWEDLHALAERYGVTVRDVDAVPWVYQNAQLVESLLDNSRPVTINFAEHSRTCVGYNDDNLLFCDNWSKTYEEKCDTGGTYESHFKAGLSVCSKWAVYSWMREVVHIAGGREGTSSDDPIVID
jgi:hypothetical protein